MRKIILLFLLLFTAYVGIGQSLSSYNLHSFNCPYDSLTTSFISMSGGTPGGGGSYDDCYYNSIPIGFNFTYCGNTYTSVSASSNCWIALGQTLPFSSTLIVNTYDADLSGLSTSGLAFPYNLPRPILAALWVDVVTTGPNVRYTTKGTAPNRVFVIEWSNCGFYNFTGVYPPKVCVEILLYETTNNIDFHYKFIASGASNTGLESIGITDGSGPYPVTGTQSFWSLSDAGPSPTASMVTETRNIATLPATGQVYRWSYQCVGTPDAGNIIASVSGACSSYNTKLSLDCISTKGSGIGYQWQSSPDSLTWTSISGATVDTYAASISATVYYRCILTCANSGLKDTTAGTKLYINPPPSAISGTTTVCVGATTALSDATAGGIWSSSNTSVATVVTGTGVVTGVTAGTARITYKLPTGCFTTTTVTVNAMPAAIGGTKTVCAGYTTLLTQTLTGGTWASGNTSVATIDPTGLVTGVSAGTAFITYSKGVGAVCSVFATVTVNPTPAAITGVPSVCAGLTTALSTSTTGGTWSSSNTSIATISTGGLVTGVTAGTSNISYILSTGCFTIITVTVNALPGAIVGRNIVCAGQTTTLANTGGGTWGSSNTAVATIGSSTGIVTGVTTGTTSITYTLTTGCTATMVMSVYPVPSAITGISAICIGGTVALSNATPGGLWSSANTAIATAGSSTGIVSGISAGTTIITYTSTIGCNATATVTVNPFPPAITGTTSICLGSTTVLSDPTPGGTWSSGNTAIADVASGTGVVTGYTLGTATITYTASTGCPAVTTVTVVPLPSAITGPTTVCPGATISLTSATTGGVWSSGSGSIAGISSTGVISGYTTGTSVITYRLPSTGCITTITVTVSSAPVAISGIKSVCVGATTTLSDAVSGGSWTSGNTGIAIIGYTSGIVTCVAAGTAGITYSLGGSCTVNTTVTVIGLPTPIGGPSSVCPGSAITVTGAVGGAWTSGNTAVATITSGGIVTGASAGTATITYTSLLTGCMVTKIITVNTLPVIAGSSTVCLGGTTSLSSATTGGSWTSSNTTIATIDPVTGVVSGILNGTSIITYTVTSTGCATTTTITVTSVPPPITGTRSICPGTNTALSNAISGGTWSSSATSIASIGSTTGIATGVSAGTATIIYIPAAGCPVINTVTVNPLPGNISGLTNICVSGSTILTNTGGGTWTSSTPAVATIGLVTGLVTGGSLGTTTITYTLPTGCIATTVVTVKPSPTTITGSTFMCMGTTATLSDAVTGGIWTSSNTSIATVDPLLGIATGVTPGTANITYSLGMSCTVSIMVTVGATPLPISGNTGICTGAPETLSSATTGGTWSSGNTSVAMIGISSGIVTGTGTGTAIITYTKGCITITTVTVSPSPTTITGTGNVCQGSTITLSNATTGGAWISSNTAVATVSGGSGIVMGVAAGTATISYTVGTGCFAVKTVTVDPVSPITGRASICTGLTTTLSNAVAGGTWTSSNTTVATIGLASGIVSGIALGSATVTYTTAAGCKTTAVISVNSTPSPITGTARICTGVTVTLSNASTGGTWTSSNTTVASAGIFSGIITGNSAGTATITYSLGFGCSVTIVATVNPSSSVITGAAIACAGASFTLSNAATGGTWTSSNTAVATITSTTGIVTGVSDGTTTITYALPAGCAATKTITINPLPAPILGSGILCTGRTLTLNTTSIGGVWSGSPSTVASISSSSGLVTAISGGIYTAVYTLGGCTASATVTVTPSPTLITGPTAICRGQTVALSNGVAGGVWTSGNKSIVAIGGSSGAATGIGSGTVLVSYTLASGCMAIMSINVNPISPISGSNSICSGQSMILIDTTLGGTWSSSNTGIATAASGTGKITGTSAGTASISYTSPTGCIVTHTITVLPLPPAITGTMATCAGQTTALSDPASGGTWSSSITAIATVGSSTGLVSGISAGTAIVSYMLGGCPATATVTINPLPVAITGPATVCIGSSITLASSGSGTWSSTTARVTVGSATGIVTGITTGTTTISYILPTGCAVSKVITINPVPGAIKGPGTVCVGDAITLSDPTTGGTWSSISTSVATITSSTSVATGVSAGTSIISYTIPNGCAATTTITVNPLPAPISGASEVCVASAITLSDTGSGTWTSSTAPVATIGLTSGTVSGISAGTTTITYTIGTGCSVTKIMTVNPLPAPITGNNPVCIGLTTSLSSATSGGTWSSSATTIATIVPVGDAFGRLSGTTNIAYTLSTGCAANMALTVTPLPKIINGNNIICLGSSVTFSDSIAGGTWSTTNTAIAGVHPFSGIATGSGLGIATIVYTMAAGCDVSLPVTVVPLPAAYTITGGGSYCSGGTGVRIGLSGSVSGTEYFLYNAGTLATGPVSGTGAGLDFGLQRVGGIYTVIAVNTITQCSNAMTGNVTITVIPSVTPTINVVAVPGDTVCNGTSTKYNAVITGGGSGPAYKWDVNGTIVGSGTSYTYVPANGDVITCQLTSSAVCATPAIVSNSVHMTVLVPQTPSATLSTYPGDTVCEGSYVTVTPIPTFGGSAPVYTWFVNRVPVGSSPALTYVPANKDIVYCEMTSNYPCLVKATVMSNNLRMTVDTAILPHVTIAADPGTDIHWGTTVTLTATATNAGLHPAYQWYLNGMPISGATTSIYVKDDYSHTKTDSITCLVTSSGLCNLTTYNWIYIYCHDKVGVNTLAANQTISILPNPNKGEFVIRGTVNTNEELTLEITDLLGQLVYKNKIQAANGNINERIKLSNTLANGMYLLNVRSEKMNEVFHMVIEQ